MRRAILYILLAMVAVIGYGSRVGVAQDTKDKAAAPKSDLRWHGVIVRINKDQSTMDIRRHNMVRTIHFDATTKWTKAQGKQTATMDEFKEGADVICLGKAGEKDSFVATEIVLNKAA